MKILPGVRAKIAKDGKSLYLYQRGWDYGRGGERYLGKMTLKKGIKLT
jgi:hypothetical protein